MDYCYVLYAIFQDRKTREPESVHIIYCADTEEKIHKYMDDIKGNFNAEYVNEHMLRVDDEGYLAYITSQPALRDF